MSNSYPKATESDAIVISTGSSDHRSKSSMFYKTKLCASFMAAGICHKGNNCSFAHGQEDIRIRPPNWRQQLVAQEYDQKRTNHPCKIFQTQKLCPYGEKCIFQHEHIPRNYQAENDLTKKYSTDEIGANAGVNVQAVRATDWNDGAGGNVKYSYWKTKLCTNYETTGNCPFGQTCNFAHGQAGGHTQSQFGSQQAIQPPAPAATRAPQESPAGGSGSNAVNATYRVGPRINWIAQEKGLGKISRIYGDWPDELPPN